ncbi:hypothetical protein GCM10009654_14280 [Streptomyces hebeiensis]|uniref:Uncharacterized protein n=1 Tax=Streptomyces hebeiensis TaxID=229486 RepID=A0ABP4FCU7_9ACTN
MSLGLPAPPDAPGGNSTGGGATAGGDGTAEEDGTGGAAGAVRGVAYAWIVRSGEASTASAHTRVTVAAAQRRRFTDPPPRRPARKASEHTRTRVDHF